MNFAFNRVGRWFVSFRLNGGFLRLALHLRWRLARVNPPAKPGYTRWYFGPFEVERFDRDALRASIQRAAIQQQGESL